MNTQGKVMLVAVMIAAGGYAGMEYFAHPQSAPLPSWISGEFGASAARYAGRTVAVDTAAIRFSHGDGTAEVLPIEWIEEIEDARKTLHILDLHVKDGGAPSTIRLIASGQDSSFRLQTMPDVAWRRLSDREARMARAAARDTSDTPVVAVRTKAARATPVASDTMIGARRFEDSDPVAKDELVQVVKSCRVYGCRIGIQGLQASRYDAFAKYLKGLGADSVTIATETATGTTLAMLEIAPKRSAAPR